MNIKIELPEEVKLVFSKLKENGFEGYAVGGCIRDSILKREINDWDITTNAKPEDVIAIFDKTIPTGIKHGTITVMINQKAYEVTTYRIDGEYLDGRHPEAVQFVDNLKEDLNRRDFTINALAYNEEDGIKDYFEGIEDLKNGIIRAVGDPKKRFEEDALRMMRCIRFASQLNYKIEDDTLDAVKSLKSNLRKVSVERIREESNKIILANPKYVYNLLELGLLEIFIPELVECKDVDQRNKHHIFNVLDHIIKSTENIEAKLYLRLTMLFHDIAKPRCMTIDDKGVGHFYGHDKESSIMAFNILKRLKYDNETIEKVVALIKYHDTPVDKSKTIRKVLNRIGEDRFYDLLKVKAADLSAQSPVYHKEGYEKLEVIKVKFSEIQKNKDCFKLSDLKINGKDLIAIGITEGSNIGIVLNRLLAKVIEDPKLNERDILINRAKEYQKRILK